MGSLKDFTVLFADDDAEYLKLFSKTLSYFFDDILTASDGKEACKLFETYACDIVILDLQMPHMSGLEVAKKIRETDKEVPIFITTNYQEFSSAAEGYRYDLVDYLVKPVSFELLMETLKRCENRLLKNQAKKQTQIAPTCRYHMDEKILHIDDSRHHLPYGESLVFEYLLSHRAQLVETLTLENLLFENELSPSGLKNIIYKLRQKLPEECIVNISKSGYMLK